MIPLFVTVDTEGDNLWERPDSITTENAKGIKRFQKFCEQYGIKPVYLTAYEMAADETFREAVYEKNHAGLCEVGMHMHPWNCPPVDALTDNDLLYLPYANEYSRDIMNKKVEFLTQFLRQRFDKEMISHRAGRWSVNSTYLSILQKHGYLVDCSYTPLMNWTNSKGDPNGNGGPDYSKCDRNPHFMELEDGKMLEIPMTTRNNILYSNMLVRTTLKLCPESLKQKRAVQAIYGRRTTMLRPDIRKEALQLKLIRSLKDQKDLRHVELMIHSSEVFAGTCPHCKTEDDIKKLYTIIGKMFNELIKFTIPMTFREYMKESIND